MAVAAADSFVDTPNLRIAVRDFGGDGVGIILIPGLSRTLADWNVIGPRLAKGHHVVAMDVRGHGRSGDGPWSWAAAVEDVDAVARHFDMSAPAVMGHSLGGMIASMWGRDHLDSAGVINLDGHGNPRADQYVALDSGWVADKRAELDAMQKQQLAALSGPLDQAMLAALTAQQKAVAALVGAPEDLFVEGLERMLDVREGGTYLRPAIDGLGGEIYASLDDVDMFAIYREIRCPLLLVNAQYPPGPPGGMLWISELMTAFRAGQTRDLRAIAADHANVRVETVAGTHAILFEQADAIVSMVLDFL